MLKIGLKYFFFSKLKEISRCFANKELWHFYTVIRTDIKNANHKNIVISGPQLATVKQLFLSRIHIIIIQNITKLH